MYLYTLAYSFTYSSLPQFTHLTPSHPHAHQIWSDFVQKVDPDITMGYIMNFDLP